MTGLEPCDVCETPVGLRTFMDPVGGLSMDLCEFIETDRIGAAVLGRSAPHTLERCRKARQDRTENR